MVVASAARMLPSCVPTTMVVLLVLAPVSAIAQSAGEPVAEEPVADDPSPPRWSDAEVEARLASAEPADIAWAGFLVRRDGLRGAVPAVRAALARLGAGPPERVPEAPNLYARLQLLDALLRLDVRLPAEELLPHAQQWLRIPALLLAARSAPQNTAYFAARMDALRQSPDLEWRACGNLLAEWRAPGFAARCLREVELAIAVTLRDNGYPPVPG